MTLTNQHQLDISVVIPFLNEEGSLKILYERLVDVIENMQKSFELIFIDDGSTDRSSYVVKEIQEKDPRVKIITFRTNKGKAEALNKGFHLARGRIVFTLDADLQDDPAEIPNFLKKIEEGYDLVSGWKKKRFDPLEKRLPSKLFNTVTSLVTGLKLHDFNCGFKAYKREILDEIKVYGELHRYIPPLAYWLGYRVGEIVIHHHPREFGKSKYGWKRYVRGFFDIFTVVLLTKYIRNPLYLFGILGLSFFLFGVIILSSLTLMQIGFGSILGHRPLSYLGVLAILFGTQSISLGLLSELLTNSYQKRGQRQVSVKAHLSHEQGGADISVIIPIHNEEQNIRALYDLLKEHLSNLRYSSEIVFVDDGSNDGSDAVLKELFFKDTAVRLIQLRKRFGKGAALQTGFDYTESDIIITMDGDLQDRPEEIGRLIEKIEEGNDLVLGHRMNVPFFRSLTSHTFNALVSFFSNTRIHDINCGLKAFKRIVLHDLNLHGEMQRLFPVIVARMGFKISEIQVTHHKRRYGSSKYGAERIPKALFDLFSVILVSGFKRRPLHLFGSVGLVIVLAGLCIDGYLTALKIFTGGMGGHYTLLLIGTMFIILGMQWFSAGILSELINRYFGEEKEELEQ